MFVSFFVVVENSRLNSVQSKKSNKVERTVTGGPWLLRIHESDLTILFCIIIMNAIYSEL